MWHHKSLLGNEGSDQSISDEDEEQDCVWPEHVVSLAGSLDPKKESLGVASQLELLKVNVKQSTLPHQPKHATQKFDTLMYGLYCKLEAISVHRILRTQLYTELCLTKSCYWKDVGFSSEDEVEIPDFHNQSNLKSHYDVEGDSISSKRDGITCKPDEQRSGAKRGSKALLKSVKAGNNVSETLDLYSRAKEKQFETCTSSAVDIEDGKVDQLSENARWPTYHPFCPNDKGPKGGRLKTKAKASSCSGLHEKKQLRSTILKGEDWNLSASDKLLDEPETIEYWPHKTSSEHLGSFRHDKMSESSLVVPVGANMQHEPVEHSRCSMAELLDSLQDKNSKPCLKIKMRTRRKGRTGQHPAVRSTSLSEKSILSDEDTCEFLHSGSSTDNEENALNPQSAIVAPERKTIADKFQEAFDSAKVGDRTPSFTVPKHSTCSSGLFGRLQQVMQWQKEQDNEFSKKLQTEVWPKDEARCIDVKILSRSFDAKLTVCHCSLLENEESALQNSQQEYFGKIWTIIFNSRVCGDIDLEVGNLIRIHPPWRELQVLRAGEIVILATYFSQI